MYRYLLLLIILYFSLETRAQELRRYVQPEYKIKYRDTTGTYLQIQNYFDRTHYTQEVYFRIKKGDEYFGESLKADSNGICLIQRTINQETDLRINKCLEIKDIFIKQNKVNKIEIRDEHGVFALHLKQAQQKDSAKNYVTIMGKKDTIQCNIPFAIKLPVGYYKVKTHAIPSKTHSIYLKPSQTRVHYSYNSVPFKIVNHSEIKAIELSYKKYKAKGFTLFDQGNNTLRDTLKLKPFVLFKVKYKKKRALFYKKMYFFTRPNEQYFKELK